MNLVKRKLLEAFLRFLRAKESSDIVTGNVFDVLKSGASKKYIDRQGSLHNHRLIKIANQPSPYRLENNMNNESQDEDVVFITSRFRSGSTVLWNIFRKIEGCTSYYEPLNERKWFNKDLRGDFIDKTHLGVNNYWDEYENMQDLNDIYQESWITDDILMDESVWDYNLKKYISELISRSKGAPVLQFNRVDFRLPWLKHNFTHAKIIHLYRNPRDTWVSFLKDPVLMNKDIVEVFFQDNFFVDIWCEDLARYFPFLTKEFTPHPYQRFYYLWRLSYIYGMTYSDLSISFENLVSVPEKTLKSVIDVLAWENVNIGRAITVVKQPELEKWKKYADDEWFSMHEKQCEDVLNSYF